jgi:DNA-binding Lrp family transcriptional regulator
MNKLKKNEIFQQRIAIFDFDKLGYPLEVLIGLRIAKGEFYDIAKKLAKDPNVHFVMDMTGHMDAEILARFKSRKQLDYFIKKLQQDPHVDSTRTRLILHIYREREIKP